MRRENLFKVYKHLPRTLFRIQLFVCAFLNVKTDTICNLKLNAYKGFDYTNTYDSSYISNHFSRFPRYHFDLCWPHIRLPFSVFLIRKLYKKTQYFFLLPKFRIICWLP